MDDEERLARFGGVEAGEEMDSSEDMCVKDGF